MKIYSDLLSNSPLRSHYIFYTNEMYVYIICGFGEQGWEKHSRQLLKLLQFKLFIIILPSTVYWNFLVKILKMSETSQSSSGKKQTQNIICVTLFRQVIICFEVDNIIFLKSCKVSLF